MTSKNLYDVFGVARTASTAEIRDAYKLRCRLLHPDRFDPRGQPREWALANELLKELNLAYEVLEGARSRTDYDRAFFGSGEKPSGTRAAEANPAAPSFSFKPGKVRYGALPASVKHRLAARIEDSAGNQLVVDLNDVPAFYPLLAITLLWPAILFYNSVAHVFYLGFFAWPFSFLIAGIQAVLANGIRAWHSARIKNHLIVTPLHIIRTELEKITFIPIESIRSIKATRRNRGAYRQTRLDVKTDDGTHTFYVKPEWVHEKMTDLVDRFKNDLRKARAENDAAYFTANDDFAGVDGSSLRPERKVAEIAVFAACLVVNLLFTGIEMAANHKDSLLN